MDEISEQQLADLIRRARVAALATIRDAEPFLSMIPFVAAADFSVFYIHINRLAQHTVDMQKNRRVGLLIAETDDGRAAPGSLASVSLRGSAEILLNGEPGFTPARDLYLARFPNAEAQFESQDFSLWGIRPKGGRFVNGLASAHNLNLDALLNAASR